jgi:hypothetical protein
MTSNYEQLKDLNQDKSQLTWVDAKYLQKEINNLSWLTPND